MAKKPVRLAGPAQLSAAAATKYTAPSYIPATLSTVIRKLHFFNADTVQRTITASIGADAAGTRILDAMPIAAGASYDLWGPFTMTSAEILQALADSANKVTLTIDGEENCG